MSAHAIRTLKWKSFITRKFLYARKGSRIRLLRKIVISIAMPVGEP
jgi:hypothetical protein